METFEQTLELRLPSDYGLIIEGVRVRKFIGDEQFEKYRQLAQNGRFLDIPYNKLTGYAYTGKRFEQKGVAIRNYFIHR
mgnify:CR=1 FL=1